MSDNNASMLPERPVNKFDCILLFGPPGSGKGTMGSFVCNASGDYHLSSGDIFRGLSPESPAGKLFHQYGHAGKLVPDEVTINVWYQFVNGLIATNQYYPEKQFLVLDGIPRTLKQAEILDGYINVKGIIQLDVEDEQVLFDRLRGRAKQEGRKDDSDEEILRTRMNVYREQTSAVLSHYPESLVSTFNANQKPVEVLRDILVGMSDVLCHKATV